MTTNKYGFGQTVADDVEPMSGAQWIRTFRDQETKIRLLPCVAYNSAGDKVTGYAAWASELEHFDEDLALSYPCLNTKAHGMQECRGCKHDSKRVRDRSRRYYVNAIGGDDDEVRIWKFGGTIWDQFEMRQKRAQIADPENEQPLSERDYFILKSGSGMKTAYSVDPGEEYRLKGGFPDPLDIGEAIAEGFEEAMKAYEELDNKRNQRGARAQREVDKEGGGSAASGRLRSRRDEDDDEPPARSSRSRARDEDDGDRSRGSRDRTGAAEDDEDRPRRSRDWKDQEDDEKPDWAGGKESPRQEAARQNGGGKPEFDITIEEIESMESVAEIREWITDNSPKGYDIPRGAPRSRLVKIAGFILEGQDPPF